MAGMNTKSGVIYDARGLVEPDPEPPMTAEIDGDSAVIDATDLTTRKICLLYTSPSPRDRSLSRMPSSA